MRIETELRNAIKSAERHQPSRMSWQDKQKLLNAAISALIKTARGNRIPLYQKQITSLENALTGVRKDLRKKYGLRIDGKGFALANGDSADSIRRFKRAGGKYPVDEKPNWTTDQVVAELVAAEPKAMHKILAKYGIVWR